MNAINVEYHQNISQSRVAKVGWIILLVVSALLMLNGLGWFFSGPGTSVSTIAEYLGITTSNFEESYPEAAIGIATTARMVAIWFMAFGTLSILVAFEGYRHGTRWAWIASWMLTAVLIAVGILELGNLFGIAMLFMAAITFAGGLMTRQGLAQ